MIPLALGWFPGNQRPPTPQIKRRKCLCMPRKEVCSSISQFPSFLKSKSDQACLDRVRVQAGEARYLLNSLCLCKVKGISICKFPGFWTVQASQVQVRACEDKEGYLIRIGIFAKVQICELSLEPQTMDSLSHADQAESVWRRSHLQRTKDTLKDWFNTVECRR